MTDGPTDHELLIACVEGDRRSWTIFVERFSRYVYYLVRLTAGRYSVSISEEDVADLHNDVFLAFLEGDRKRLRAYSGKNGCSVRSWVRVVAIRRVLDQFRRRKSHISLDVNLGEDHQPLIQQLADDGPDPLEQLGARDEARRREALAGLAAELSESDRLLLELLFNHKMTADEIAAALNIKKGAVYTRKTRLIKRLRSAAESSGLIESESGV